MPLSEMDGVPSAASSRQFVKQIGVALGLYNSIHSSPAKACVPIQATSLMMTALTDAFIVGVQVEDTVLKLNE